MHLKYIFIHVDVLSLYVGIYLWEACYPAALNKVISFSMTGNVPHGLSKRRPYTVLIRESLAISSITFIHVIVMLLS